jgi:3-phenylpropionate/trans-cinnamate dioxygenase ferredoxin reductase subunit
VHNALEQAKTAAGNLCGGDSRYSQVPWFWSDQYDIKLQIVGLSDAYDKTVLRGDPATGRFACFYLRDGRLIAADAINSPREFMQSKALIAQQAAVPGEILADATVPLKDLV